MDMDGGSSAANIGEKWGLWPFLTTTILGPILRIWRAPAAKPHPPVHVEVHTTVASPEPKKRKKRKKRKKDKR